MQQVDARLNEWQGALDAINGLTLTDPRTNVNTLNASGSVTLDIVGKATLMVDINVTVTFNAATTLVLEGSVDGTNFFTLPFFVVQSTVAAIPAESMSNIIPGSTAAGARFLLCASCTGFRTVRVRMSFTTAGTATIAARATAADYRIIAQPQPTILWVSATAAAGSAVTATLPAAAAGLFHYITYLHIMRSTNVAEATAAPLNITTVNFPSASAAAWTVGAAVPTGGQVTDVDLQPSQPIKSLLAATNTQIVCPDPGTSAIWRVNVGYYLGA